MRMCREGGVIVNESVSLNHLPSVTTFKIRLPSAGYDAVFSLQESMARVSRERFLRGTELIFLHL